MDKFVQTELEGAGVNVEETLRRFMNNEMLMIKFLRKFVDDENMNKLRTLIADKHYNEVLPSPIWSRESLPVTYTAELADEFKILPAPKITVAF